MTILYGNFNKGITEIIWLSMSKENDIISRSLNRGSVTGGGA